MKYFTFQPQFHAAIIAFTKRSTIRPKQKVKVGERFALRFWTGSPYRSKMGMLGTATCREVSRFIIGPNGMGINDCLVQNESALAEQEGFRSCTDMRAWFLANHGEVFTGWLHVWDTFTPYAASGAGGDMLCRECGKPIFPGHPAYANGYDELMDIATSNCCLGRTATDAAMPANAKADLAPASGAQVQRLVGCDEKHEGGSRD